jgi:hypothetical protein
MDSDLLSHLIAKHQANGILLDSNLAILMVVGTYDISAIQKHKRTKAYTKEDYLLLKRLLGLFKRTLTTPNILTETDNLARQIAYRGAQIPAAFLSVVQDFDEKYFASTQIGQSKHFARLGLADAATIMVSGDTLVLTDDLQLALQIGQLGGDVINFNHIRYLGS